MVCDDTMTKWTIHALEQADVILTVLNFSETEKEPQGIEKKIMEMKFKTTREVVFLHPHITDYISGTSEWLNLRKGYHQHFHIRYFLFKFTWTIVIILYCFWTNNLLKV